MVNFKRIKALRKVKGMTQAELAQKTNIAQCYVSKIEAGEFEPSIMRLGKIAKVLGVTVTDLLK